MLSTQPPGYLSPVVTLRQSNTFRLTIRDDGIHARERLCEKGKCKKNTLDDEEAVRGAFE